MLLDTRATNFFKARQVSATDTSFPSKIPTGTEPTGKGTAATTASVIDLVERKTEGKTNNSVIIVPYGTGDDNDVFAMRVIGWRYVNIHSYIASPPAAELWVPVKLCELTCTCSTVVGIASAPVAATERFCDTIALVGTSGNDDISLSIVSPADNTIAHVTVDLLGFQKLELTFDSTTGDPTDMNALLAFI